MPPRVAKESLLLLINIGVTSIKKSNDPSLLVKAKCIARKKIEKMIFLRPKDEVAVIVMGSSNTKNSLDIEHVEEFADFQVPNWDLIKKLENLECTNYCSNWVEALYAAVEFMKANIYDVSKKKIILMSDFNEESDIISQFQANKIAEQLFTIELITIGEDLLETDERSLKISEVLLKFLHKKINGQHLTYDMAISALRFYTEESKKPSPSYFDLELIDIKIPIVSFVKVDESKFPPWKRAKNDEKVVSKTEYVDRQRTTYTKDEIVAGYKYGEIFVPVEKEQEEAMRYKSGTKGYKIHSFTSRNNINLEYLYSKGTHVILPSTKGKDVTKLFYSLVQAMRKTNAVAIARKVYRDNLAPKMVALFPCTDVPDEPWCLVEIALTYSEDRRVMETRPIKSVVKQLTDDQNEAVDNLIDSLTLSDMGDSYEVDGSQYFLPGCVPNPAIQHRWHALSHRALNPDKPLPSVEDYLKEILEVPLIKEKSKQYLKRITELFQLEDVDPKKDDEKKENEEDNAENNDDINFKLSDKMKDKVDDEDDSYKQNFMDTSDVDLDELAANI
ncbi:X-ray repair cross-complementing protein 5 isoform X1 [Osmia lignaria lignaria]|uniref:X-ray repair cross-complementing protein 5 isoform X1 n=2 Tax=Osmia lignaria lignaria TaxID=1437193 RepID=UPI00402BCF89